LGAIATCTTPNNGVCIATESQVGDYLVIIKYVDSVNHFIVYEGLPKGPKDFVNNVATKLFTIVKKLKNGVFQEYQGGNKFVICPEAGCPR